MNDAEAQDLRNAALAADAKVADLRKVVERLAADGLKVTSVGPSGFEVDHVAEFFYACDCFDKHAAALVRAAGVAGRAGTIAESLAALVDEPKDAK